MTDAMEPIASHGWSARDSKTTQTVLAAWLQKRMPNAGNLLLSNWTRMGGMSNELLGFDAEWREAGTQHRRSIAIRFDPVDFRKRRHSNLQREFAVLSILNASGKLAVPETYWYEADENILGAAFFAMERLAGRIPSDQPPFQTQGWVLELSPQERRRLWANAILAMAEVHKLPADQFACLRRQDAGASDFEQQLTYWRDHYDWVTAGAENRLGTAAWHWLLSHIPETIPQGLSWGDARYANMMFDENLNCRAMLDWEDVSLISPLNDLARWCFTEDLQAEGGCPRLEGMGTREETIALWADRTGHQATSLRWFDIFTAVCALGLVLRMRQLSPEASAGPPGLRPFSSECVESLLSRWLAAS